MLKYRIIYGIIRLNGDNRNRVDRDNIKKRYYTSFSCTFPLHTYGRFANLLYGHI
jgi:hypothetical protein